MDYLRLSKIMKAIADPNRLQILDMISTGEKCACDILDDFEFTQPTLSHHMKVLIEAGIVTARKEGKWHYYSLVTENVEEFQKLTNQIFKMNLKEGAM
ncbi:ArsR/SmtB family transcription factor [Tetragenococcus koreensis]|uniref:ArsR family transcriptional regulator n=1 Tax=Tetragenococcus koreensis TaxID=290335 RepID=A0AAN4ZQ07_9ENTE|nr:metalloregulator ArsR/SmtB family transcription factor [Tetragenococcus koreensis]GEQ50451.1 ArsR family transcriptional regulator [Tetragenococcus koreensis]GEQ52954.1 ArsR family transcriptional regulator [Tetragenococcus koreensis]GEQ55444.1 ArsR family transcriptional regulator [Tetragenococcus koreensis]GEQ57929.1 ArsR family transcriptional regulator [Tetragenococcus koreensis]GEQ60436.1 ArsR family transcriptional regulator [Tetragenococcus koreensis]